MRITQGTFSFLPDFTDEQISAQIQYCLDNGWALNFEYTDDPHPRNTYWEMWGIPLFDIADAAGVMMELAACRKVHAGTNYIRMTAFDSSHGWESIRLSMINDRTAQEPGFMVDSQEQAGRRIADTTADLVAHKTAGRR